MIIKDITFYIRKSNTTYEQGIKGPQNYNHDVKSGRYNGSGGKLNFGKTSVMLSCFIDDKEIYVDVSNYLKEFFNRKRITEEFIYLLNCKCSSKVIEVPNEFRGNIHKLLSCILESITNR